jgi:hypothetical protein
MSMIRPTLTPGRLGVVLLVALLAGCGSTAQERAEGRMRLLAADLDAAHEEWKAALDRRWFRSNLQAMSDLESRYQRVYTRWGLRPDPLVHALLSYGIAVADRVDRRHISKEEADRLYRQMRGDVEQARGEILAQSPEGQVQFEVKSLAWWKAYWERNRRAFEATPGDPVQCAAVADQAGDEAVKCR